MHPRQRITINGIAMSSLSCLIGFFRDGHGQLPDEVKRSILEVFGIKNKPETSMHEFYKERDQLIIKMLKKSFDQVVSGTEKQFMSEIIRNALAENTLDKNEETVQFIEQ